MVAMGGEPAGARDHPLQPRPRLDPGRRRRRRSRRRPGPGGPRAGGTRNGRDRAPVGQAVFPVTNQVLVAIGGGVDSSVAAALAVEAGWDVTGVHLKLADTPAHLQVQGKGCCTWPTPTRAPGGSQDPRHPFRHQDMAEEFQRAVVDDFAAEYAGGRTPQPVRPLQRAGQGGGAAGAGPGPRLRRPGHRPLRTESGGGHSTGARTRPGPVVRPLHARPGRAGAAAAALGPADQAAGAGDRGPPRPQDRRQAGVPATSASCPTATPPRWLERRLGTRPGEVVDTAGRVLGHHQGATTHRP